MLSQKKKVNIATAVGILLTAIFFLISPLAFKSDYIDWSVSAIFALILLAGVLFVLKKYSDEDMGFILVFMVILFAGMLVRMAFVHIETSDYQRFLSHWLSEFRILGLDAFKDNSSDYNASYLYFIYIFSRLKVPELALLKALSVSFDMVLTLAGVGVISILKNNNVAKLLTVILLWLGPTVILNGSLWGQCDSIYGAFCMLALLYILRGRPVLSVVMAALAFSFKIQAIFFLPVYVVFLIAKKVKIQHALVFPLTYVLTCAPAVMLGMSVSSIVGVYYNQAKQYSGYLNLNAASMFALIPTDANAPALSTAGIAFAFVFILYLLYVAYYYRNQLSSRALVLFSYCMCLGIPWLLPSMHERYFFLADIMAVIVIMLYPKKWFLLVLTLIGSYAGYHAYLFQQFLSFFWDVRFSGMGIPALLMLAALGSALLLLHKTLEQDRRQVR